MNKQENRQKLLYMITIVLFLLLHITSLFLIKAVIDLRIIPDRYVRLLVLILVGFNGIIAATLMWKKVRTFIRIIAMVLSLLIISVNVAGTNLLPDYKGRFEKIFVPIPETTELNMNIYALENKGYSSLNDIVGKTMAIQKTLDVENQQIALDELSVQLKGKTFKTVEYDDFYSAVEALYAGEVDFQLLNEVYADIIMENADYEAFSDDVVLVKQINQELIDSHTAPTEYTGDVTKSPFVVAIAGNDTFSYGNISASAKSRTDVNIVCIVNPNTNQILMVTLPRDSYLGIGGDKKKMDKLTHASIYGIEAWRKTIEAALEVDINFYVRVNFTSLINIVDALGGITIDNPYAFNSTRHKVLIDGKQVKTQYHYDKGIITLSGNEALLYVRERKNLKNDDLDRNAHQAIVLKALIDKVISKDMITKFSKLLDSVQGTFVTDITMDQIYALAQMQLDRMRSWDIITSPLSGRTGGAPSYAMGKKELSMVFLNQDSVDQAKALIKQIMNNELLSDQ